MGEYLITLRCHQNDHNLFEEYIILIKDWLEGVEKYSYSIELDDTINRHLHLFINHDARDSDKLRREFTSKGFKKINIKTKSSKTILSNALKIDKVTKTRKKALGYVNKFNSRRRDHKGYTDQEILDAVEFYYTTERIEKSEETVSDWKHVTNKNFHASVEDYIKNNPELLLKDSDLIKIRMVKDKYTFQLNVKDQERYFKELRIAHEQCSEQDIHSCSQEAYGQDKTYDRYMEDDIRDLLKYIKSLKDKNIDINVPNNIYNIDQKYNY